MYLKQPFRSSRFSPREQRRTRSRGMLHRELGGGLIVWLLAVICLVPLPVGLAADNQKAGPQAAAPKPATELKKDKSDQAHDLAVRPERLQVVNEELRPDWVERKPWTEAGVFKIWVSGDPAETEDEARDSLEEALVRRVRKHASNFLAGDAPGFLTRSYVRQHLTQVDPYLEQVTSPTFGTMYVGHGLLSLDSSYISQLEDIKHESEMAERIEITAVLAGAILGLLGLGALILSRRANRHAHWRPWDRPEGIVADRVETEANRGESRHERRAGRRWTALLLVVFLGPIVMFALLVSSYSTTHVTSYEIIEDQAESRKQDHEVPWRSVGPDGELENGPDLQSSSSDEIRLEKDQP